MKANVRSKKQNRGDEGVSPVIAVILMVAITVVLAATVYVWVSGFASDDQGTENAQVRAAGLTNSNGEVHYLRLTLVKGENAPYGEAVVGMMLLDPSGDTGTAGDAADATTAELLCNSPATTTDQSGLSGNDRECTVNPADNWYDGTDATWDVGQTLYVPCQESGAHQITLTIRGSTVLDQRMNCDTAAPT